MKPCAKIFAAAAQPNGSPAARGSAVLFIGIQLPVPGFRVRGQHAEALRKQLLRVAAERAAVGGNMRADFR